MEKYLPVGEKLVVEMLPNEKKSAAGIIIPGREDIPSNRAKILVVPENLSEKYKVDEVIIIDSYAGMSVDPEDEKRKVRILKEDDVWAKVTDVK
jgi:co-chaperonin GroES (HSP10)